MVEGARLESEYTAKPYRGFESHPLRHIPLLNPKQAKIAAAMRRISDLHYPRYPSSGTFHCFNTMEQT